MDLGMLKAKRIYNFWILVIMCFTSFKKTEARINASIDNFYLTCGSRGKGPMDITFNNFNSQTIASIYTNNKPNECGFLANGTIYNIVNARKRGCAIQDSTSPYLSFYAVVTLQEDRWFQRNTDPKFLLSCAYTGGDVKVRTAPFKVLDNLWHIQDYQRNVVHGYVDMTYKLGIYEDDGVYNRPMMQALFGQKIALKISMSGTDEDEKGIRVRSCVASSGGMEAEFIQNYCSSSRILPRNAGFISNGTQALLTGLETFRLTGSEDPTVTFECLLDVCPDICDGENCRSKDRVKRDTFSRQNFSHIQAYAKIKILAFNQQYTDPTNHSCINQLEFTVPIICLGTALCITLYALICILKRQRKSSKRTAENIRLF